jgi:hypothetical protein
MTTKDLFRQRAIQCRRLAAAARNADDKAFWLELAERWEEARRRCLKEVLTEDSNSHVRKRIPSRHILN